MATRGEEATADELCAQANLFGAASHLYRGIWGLLRTAADVAARTCAGGRRGAPGKPVRPEGVGTPAVRHDPSGEGTRVPGGAAQRKTVRARPVGRGTVRARRGCAVPPREGAGLPPGVCRGGRGGARQEHASVPGGSTS